MHTQDMHTQYMMDYRQKFLIHTNSKWPPFRSICTDMARNQMNALSLAWNGMPLKNFIILLHKQFTKSCDEKTTGKPIKWII